jgi:hypothetical protein
MTCTYVCYPRYFHALTDEKTTENSYAAYKQRRLEGNQKIIREMESWSVVDITIYGTSFRGLSMSISNSVNGLERLSQYICVPVKGQSLFCFHRIISKTLLGFG